MAGIDLREGARATAGVRRTRRSLLGTAAGLSGAALAAGAWRPSPGETVREAATRQYTSSQYALKLASQDAGALKSVEGGAIYGEVLTGPTADFYSKKQIGAVRYEDVVLAEDVVLPRSGARGLDQHELAR